MRYGFCDFAMSPQSVVFEEEFQCDVACHANTQNHNATKVLIKVIEKIEDSPTNSIEVILILLHPHSSLLLLF